MALSFDEIRSFLISNTELEEVSYSSCDGLEYYLNFNDYQFRLELDGSIVCNDGIFKFNSVSDLIEFIAFHQIPFVRERKYEQLSLW